MQNSESTIYAEKVTEPDLQQNALGKTWAWILLLFIGNLWGSTFSLAKIATENGAHPLGITYWQSLIGAFFLLVLTLGSRRKIPLDRNSILFFVACGLLGSIIPGVIFYHAASRVSPGILSITIATIPMITFVASVVLGIEKFKILRIAGVFCGTVSILLLVGPEESLPDPSVIPWIFAAILSAACYASENLLVALRMPKGIHISTVACGLFVAAVIMMTPVIIISDTFVPLIWPWGRVEWAIIGLSVISVTAYSIFIYLIAHAGPVFASQTAYVVTFSGVLWGILIFDETHSVWIWASLVIMLAALALVTPHSTKHT